jgi:Fe-S-cluster-containing hydrogenase component 2
MLKCDQCAGMDAPFCVESCPTHALVFLDPEQVAQGSVTLRKGSRLVGLAFAAAKGLSKGASS